MISVCGAIALRLGGIRDFCVWLAFHRKGDAVAGEVDFEHGHADLLLDLDDVGRIFHKLIRKLADVDMAVLVDADVHECAEGRYVGDDTGEGHSGLEVPNLVDTIGEAEGLELLAGIATGLAKLIDDVVKGREANVIADESAQVNFRQTVFICDEVAYSRPEG